MIFATLQAQKSGQRDFELGVMAGISWYNGDLNPDRFFNPRYLHQAQGLFLRKNINRRFSWKNSLLSGRLSANDEFSTSPFRVNRNLNFSSPIHEIASVFEFNYLEFDQLIPRMRFSPYTFIGLSGFWFNPSTSVEGNVYQLRPLMTENRSYKNVSVAIPFGFGFRFAATDRLIFNFEWGLRKTFTDYIDDVSGRYPNEGQLQGLSSNLSDRSLKQSGANGTNWGTQRGDDTNKDWFSMATASLAWRLGPKKGSCKQIGF